MPCSACGGGSGSSSATHFNLKGNMKKHQPKMLTKVVKLTPMQYHYYIRQLQSQQIKRQRQFGLKF